MARSIRQIQQELEQIKQAVTDSAEELQTLYEKYLATLSESSKKQLILAGYQICTQIYPESFVAMSLGQRQKLQQTLRQLGDSIQPLLAQKPTPEELSQEQTDLSLIAEMLKNLPLNRPSNRTQPIRDRQEKSEEPENSPEIEESIILEDDVDSAATLMIQEGEELIVEEIPEFSLEKLQNLADQETDTPKIQEIDFSNPHHLILWHKIIEIKIKKTLDDISRKANKNLQEFRMIPSRLPSKVMEIALQAGDGNSGNNKVRNIPNILNLVLENNQGQKGKKTNGTQISLLRLRLSEIEFADPMLSSHRNEIRLLIKKIKQLENLHKQKQREYAQSEADAAWRSSWYED